MKKIWMKKVVVLGITLKTLAESLQLRPILGIKKEFKTSKQKKYDRINEKD